MKTKHRYEQVWDDYCDMAGARQKRFIDYMDAVKAFQDDPENNPLPEGEPPHLPILEDQKEEERERAMAFVSALCRDFPDTVPAEHIENVLAWSGRVWGPMILSLLEDFGRLDGEGYALTPHVWSLAEFPGAALTLKDWRALWDRTNFTIDGEEAERPTEPITLYRASWPQFKRAMSWTASRERAEWFLRARSGNVRLYTVVAPPENLYAYVHEDGRTEEEWVLDTRGLQIKEVKDSPATV